MVIIHAGIQKRPFSWRQKQNCKTFKDSWAERHRSDFADRKKWYWRGAQSVTFYWKNQSDGKLLISHTLALPQLILTILFPNSQYQFQVFGREWWFLAGKWMIVMVLLAGPPPPEHWWLLKITADFSGTDCMALYECCICWMLNKFCVYRCQETERINSP